MVYFIPIVVLGALVLPTVLIGIVTVTFQEAQDRINHEAAVALQVHEVSAKAPTFATSARIRNLQVVYRKLDCDMRGTLDFDGASCVVW